MDNHFDAHLEDVPQAERRPRTPNKRAKFPLPLDVIRQFLVSRTVGTDKQGNQVHLTSSNVSGFISALKWAYESRDIKFDENAEKCFSNFRSGEY